MGQPKTSPQTIRLPKEEELLLKEEVADSARSRNSIIIEALRIRRAVLEAMGVQAAGTEPREIADSAVKLIKLGIKAKAKAEK